MKTATFTMGVPAAGKTTIVESMYKDTTIIDPDKIKEGFVGYNPLESSVFHAESQKIAEKQFKLAILGEEDFVLDGTGTNAEKLIRRITEAKSCGFKINLIYVVVPLKISLERNRNRQRVVPVQIVVEKYQDIRYAFDAVAPHADSVLVINNE